MEEVSTPPPLPPKTRRSPPGATVLSYSLKDSSEFNTSCINANVIEDKRTHVVKIQINPKDDDVTCVIQPCIRINVNQNTDNMVQNQDNYFFYDQFNIMSSGQISPSDTLDSGTCSDLDNTPPPLPKKSGVSVTIIGEEPKRLSSLGSSSCDSDDNSSTKSYEICNKKELRANLLQDIRNKNGRTNGAKVDEKSYEERRNEANEDKCKKYETDVYYNFHLNENVACEETVKSVKVDDDDFAGVKDLLGDGASTIRSAKGTVRGVKNRVRAGIATFLQINSNVKNYKEKEMGKVVVYSTTMGILRDTYQACNRVKQILRTLLVKFEERDVFMSNEYQSEIRERMKCDQVLVPQVFVDGQHIGDAETVEKLNESGELRRIMKPFKSMDACIPCKMCGGYRLLPCSVCNGSKKSVHRNHFTTEFVALKCMNCDEVGLVKCTSC